MDKKAAAEFLGVSVRALERYVQQGRISVRYEKGKTRPTANFDQAELEAFKAELNQPSYKPAIESRQIATEYQPQQDNALTHSGEISEFGEISAIEKLAGIIEKLLHREFPSVFIADKLLLTLPEVQVLTGLSREFLRDAISQGKLKAQVIGKSWRIKRSDLDDYVADLF